MSKTKPARRRSGGNAPRRRPIVWIACGGIGLALCILAVSRLWRSAPSTAATGPGDRIEATSETPGSNRPRPAPPRVPYYGYRIIRTFPHDPENFTQGLVYSEGILYEGTGLYGQSALIKRTFTVAAAEPNGTAGTPTTGEGEPVFKKTRLPDRYFGEGIALFGEKIIQLTWQSRVGFVYDKDTLRQTGTFRYDTQGWGLTHDGKRLILSDGSDTIRFLDPNTYAVTGQLRVYDERRPVSRLNELEYIDGLIYANIWPTDTIAIISPENGRVTAWIDLTGLHVPPPDDEDNEVANGIAYLPETQHLLVTGKLWPHMYEIELVPLARPSGAP